MTTSILIRWCGFAAALGGVMWVIKGGTIMLGGPRWLEWGFGIALPLFAVGLLGLYGLLQGRAKGLGRASVLLVFLSGALIAFSALYAAVTGGSLTGEEFVFPLSLTILGGFLSLLGGLVLLGIAALRAKALPPPWSAFPLAMALLPFPSILLGGALATVNERLLEVPIVAMGLAWMGLGYLIWSSAGKLARRPRVIP